MDKNKIAKIVKTRYREKSLLNYLNTESVIYPVSVHEYFPYSSKYDLYENFTVKQSDIKSLYNTIKEEYDYNCIFVLNNIDRINDIFIDGNTVLGLGEVTCKDLIKQSLFSFKTYSTAAAKLLEKLQLESTVPL